MKIAIVCDNNRVSQHFGKSEGFYVYDENNKTYYKSKGHGEIPNMLADLGIDFVACGGIGDCALKSLQEKNIKVFHGLEGLCDDIAKGFFKGILIEGNQNCHKDHSHSSGHSCKCGEHK